LPDTRDTEPDARGDAAARTRSSSASSGRRWSFVAAVCAVTAVVLLIAVGVNAAFVAAVLGVVAWFWDQRNRIRASVIEDESREEGRDELEEFDDTEEFGEEDGRDERERRVYERRSDDV
jgi:hypothetical protein